MRTTILRAGIGLGLLCAAAAPAGANVLTNGSFDGGLTGWDTSFNSANFQLALFWAEPSDRTGTPGSSAGIMQNTSPTDASVGTVPLNDDGCFPVTPSDVVHTSGWVLLPVGQGRTGNASLSVAYYANADCTSFLAYGYPAALVSAIDGQWHAFADERTPAASTQSMRVGLTLRKNEAGGSLTAWFDDLVVTVPEPLGEAGGCVALAVLAGLAMPRRSRRRAAPLALACAVAIGLAACGGEQEPPSPAPSAAPAPAETPAAAPAPAPAPAAKPDASKGAALYAANCASCHGAAGAGDGPAGAALVPKPARHDDGAYMNALSNEHLFRVVKEGGPAVGKSPLMAPWGGVLTDAQVWDVVAFVRSLAKPPYTGPVP